MKTKFFLSTALVLTVVLAACAPKAATPTEKATIPTSRPPVTNPTTAPTKTVKTSPSATPTAIPTKKPDSTPNTSSTAETPFATPTVGPALINDIAVDDQQVKSGTVLVSMVDSLQPGWVAIFTDDNGQPGKLLGYVAVPAGTSSDVKVTIDAKGVTSKMIAMLLVDAGTIGTFEYPGADTPVKNANVNTAVMAVFNKVGGSSQ